MHPARSDSRLGRGIADPLDRIGAFEWLGGGRVESVMEDRFDAAVAVTANGERPCGGRFHAGVAVASGQPQEPEAGAAGLLGMTAGVEDGGDQGGVCGPTFSAWQMKRSGVHSPIWRCCSGMCSGAVV